MENDGRYIGDALSYPADRVARWVTQSGPKWCEPTPPPASRIDMPPIPLRYKLKGQQKQVLAGYRKAMTRKRGATLQWLRATALIPKKVDGLAKQDLICVQSALARLVLGYKIRPKDEGWLTVFDWIASQ